MAVVLLLLVTVPLAATLLCVMLPLSETRWVTLGAGLVSLALAVALLPATGQGVVTVGFFRVDALSEVFLLATAFLYATVAAYSVGYERPDGGGHKGASGHRRHRLFQVGLNVFAWSMLCAPAVDGLAALWVAIEVTTVVSALLVALDDTEGATEAAWKYLLIASAGLGVGLLATIFLYQAGSGVLGTSYDLQFQPLLDHAAQLPAIPTRLAFTLAVIGFGTKVGLFPVHTWLPDAHAEAPTPVSALLSGSLLAISFYAILRYYQIAVGSLGPRYPQGVLLVFGVASLLLAALYLVDQRDLKRLLAYSSVEHMGILAIGVSFGTTVACAGVLLHVLGHAVAKSNAFMGAGVVVRAAGTKRLSRIRGVLDRQRWTGPLFLVSVLALSAFPPFALFRSEFLIVSGGLGNGRHLAAAALVVLVTLAFLGLVTAVTRVLFQPPSARPRPRKRHREPDVAAGPERLGWLTAPVAVGVLALLVLGLWPPAAVTDVLSRGAALLAGGA
jgi:hydrogenase-4 component F